VPKLVTSLHKPFKADAEADSWLKRDSSAVHGTSLVLKNEWWWLQERI